MFNLTPLQNVAEQLMETDEVELGEAAGGGTAFFFLQGGRIESQHTRGNWRHASQRQGITVTLVASCCQPNTNTITVVI